MTRASLTDPAPPAFDPAAVLTAEDVRNRHGQEDARIRHLNRVRDGSQPPACAWCHQRMGTRAKGERFLHDGMPLSNRFRTKFKSAPFWFCFVCSDRLLIRAEWIFSALGNQIVWPSFEPPLDALDMPSGVDTREFRYEWWDKCSPSVMDGNLGPRVPSRTIYPPEPWERRLWAAFDRVRKENAPCPSAPEVQKETEAPSSESR